jgi:hypothetical protein
MIDVVDEPPDKRHVATESTSECFVTELFKLVDAGLHAPIATCKTQSNKSTGTIGHNQQQYLFKRS